jgi:hypothetical protein
VTAATVPRQAEYGDGDRADRLQHHRLFYSPEETVEVHIYLSAGGRGGFKLYRSQQR